MTGRPEKRIEIGTKFNLLTLTRPCLYKKQGRTNWTDWWTCACGNTVELERYKVVSGNNKSCGCLGDKVRKLGGKRVKGFSSSIIREMV